MVLWSLEVEAQFYLLAPLLAVVYRLGDRRVRVWVFLCVGAGLHLLAPVVFWNDDNFFHYALYFTVGMVVADFHVGRDGFGRADAQWLDWLVVGAIPLSVLVSNRGWAAELVLPLHAGLALIAALRGGAIARLLRNQALVTVGGMCYTVYLYHYLMISVLGRFTASWFGGLPYELFFLSQFLVQGLAIVAMCAVLFRFIERPFMAVSAQKLVERLRA